LPSAKGCAFGSKKPAQVVIWENLMDAQTVLLTANTETVYAMSHLDLDLAMAALLRGIGANAIRANSSESGGYK
jgi:hypothetical protein